MAIVVLEENGAILFIHLLWVAIVTPNYVSTLWTKELCLGGKPKAK